VLAFVLCLFSNQFLYTRTHTETQDPPSFALVSNAPTTAAAAAAAAAAAPAAIVQAFKEEARPLIQAIAGLSNLAEWPRLLMARNLRKVKFLMAEKNNVNVCVCAVLWINLSMDQPQKVGVSVLGFAVSNWCVHLSLHKFLSSQFELFTVSKVLIGVWSF